MAGHSQFKNIMHRKGAQDSKKANKFAKIAREIIVAVKTGGADANTNPRLRGALSQARSINMPKDNIDRAIKKALGNEDQSNYEDIRYEGYGIGGVAVIVEALSDNKNRTASEVRSSFSKYSGNLGETGSVSFCFSRVGQLIYSDINKNYDELFEIAIQAGADDIIEFQEDDKKLFEIITSIENFLQARDFLIQELKADPIASGIIFKPLTLSKINIEQEKTLLKMLDILEDLDDVQNVYHNAQLADD